MAYGAIAAVAAVVISGASAYESSRQAKSAAKKEKEAGKVAAAEQAAQQTAQTRAQIREERVRRAQILQSSENTGVTGSSGALGSTGALQTTVGANLASASRQTNAANAITGLQQKAADFRSQAAQTQAIGSFASSAVSAGGSIYSANQVAAVPTQTAQPVQQGAFSPATESNPYDLFR